MVFRMNIDKLEPGKRVVWSCHGDHPEWSGTVLIWELSIFVKSAKVLRTHTMWKLGSAGDIHSGPLLSDGTYCCEKSGGHEVMQR
jgi:hypothetical protein